MKIEEIVINKEIQDSIQNKLYKLAENREYNNILQLIPGLYNKSHQNIPVNKRISYGSYYVVKILGKHIFESLQKNNLNSFDILSALFEKANERKTKGIIFSALSYYGLEDYITILPFIEQAAGGDDWEVREFASGFIRKITKKYPDQIKEFYLRLVKSENENLRRFVSESLRPVTENRWFVKNPEYPLSIIKNLFQESKSYPRTSVGNNLSDWANKNPEMTYKIIIDLVNSGNKNSYWIAYRACRNLVKKDPIKVMGILKIDEYKYKTRIHKRNKE